MNGFRENIIEYLQYPYPILEGITVPPISATIHQNFARKEIMPITTTKILMKGDPK